MKSPARLQKKGGNFFILLTILSLINVSFLRAQLSPAEEKAMDEYFTEILKVYRIIDQEDDVQTAIRKIDARLPEIDKKAKILAEKVNRNPEFDQLLESDELFEMFQHKPYFQETMELLQDESFSGKLMGSAELLKKLEEVDKIGEAYLESGESPGTDEAMPGAEEAFSISLSGASEISGTYTLKADFEEGAIAYIDDLGYLRIYIYGYAGTQEGSVEFFVDNTGTGKQNWQTEGQFSFELVDENGDLIISLYGTENDGSFEILTNEGPGGFVTGTVSGTCHGWDDENEDPVSLKASFKARYMED